MKKNIDEYPHLTATVTRDNLRFYHYNCDNDEQPCVHMYRIKKNKKKKLEMTHVKSFYKEEIGFYLSMVIFYDPGYYKFKK